jgi:HEPN domain/Polymerase beta, Nucleotidyltransferase
MTEATLARPRPQIDDPEELDRILRNLVDAFDPLAIFLFGSRARSEAWQDSDYDLMVVLGDDRSPGALKPTALWPLVRSDRIDANVTFSTGSAYGWRRHAVGTLEYEVEMDGVQLHPSTKLVFPPGQSPHLRASNVKIVDEWLGQVQQDIDAAIDCVHGPRVVPSRGAFHVQQAAEKLAKAALVAHRIRPEKTHEIKDVVAALPGEFPLKERLSALERFSDYAVAFRYPGGATFSIPSTPEIEAWIAEIEALKADFERWLKARAGQQGVG